MFLIFFFSTIEDDIDIEDHHQQQQQEQPKEQGILSGLSKQKLANTFSSFKGKLKQMKAKNEKSVVTNEEKHEEKNGTTVDQIKKKYGFASSEVSFYSLLEIFL